MRQARASLERRDRKAFFTGLEKSAAIVVELQCTLKPEVAPELSEQLRDIYGFVVGRLAEAAVRTDGRLITEAERAFAPVVDAFVQAAAQVQSQQGQSAPAPQAA